MRGHVELTLSVDRSAQQKAGYNRELVGGLSDAFKQAQRRVSLKGEPDLNAALRMPGALQAETRSNCEEDLAALTESAVQEIGPLLEELKVMRAREGESLEAFCGHLLIGLPRRPMVLRACGLRWNSVTRSGLTQRLTAATGNEFNRQRLLEEVAVLVDHSDVSEELERMVDAYRHTFASC